MTLSRKGVQRKPGAGVRHQHPEMQAVSDPATLVGLTRVMEMNGVHPEARGLRVEELLRGRPSAGS